MDVRVCALAKQSMYSHTTWTMIALSYLPNLCLRRRCSGRASLCICVYAHAPVVPFPLLIRLTTIKHEKASLNITNAHIIYFTFPMLMHSILHPIYDYATDTVCFGYHLNKFVSVFSPQMLLIDLVAADVKVESRQQCRGVAFFCSHPFHG